MTMLPDFKLETHFSKWEFKARYHMTASDAESISLRDLLSMATPAKREDFEGMWLGYTETWGALDLRNTIGDLRRNGRAPRPGDGWSLDIDRVAAAIRPNTRLMTINFPHNPTGTILPLDRYEALIALCRKHGIYILHDEIFNGLGPTQVFGK